MIATIYILADKTFEELNYLDEENEFRILRGSKNRLFDHVPVNQELALIIFNDERFNLISLTTVREIRRHFRKAAILIASNEIPIRHYQQLAAMDKVATLQKCDDRPAVLAIIKSLVAGLKPSPSAFPRFRTDQPVQMISIASGLLVQSRMKNYSPGRAFLEYRGLSFQAGDKIQVSISNRERPDTTADIFQSRAKVIWYGEAKSGSSTLKGIGVQFLQD